MQPLQQILAQLEQFSTLAEQAPDLVPALEEQFEQFVVASASQPFALDARNRFRIRHAAHLKIRRPRVLYGSRSKLLNFHAVPLLAVADVLYVVLSQSDQPAQDVIVVDPFTQDMSDVLAALPKGFVPDLYFDYQTCSLDRYLRGLERAPFPTVASLCHHFYAWKVDAVARQFDYVLPLSSRYCDILKNTVDPRKILDVPFGLSWGSFHHIIGGNAADPRPIDVLMTFPGEGPMFYGPYRKITAALFEKAKAKYGARFRFEMVTGLSRDDYIALLGAARIVINAVGIHGPYNYRSCEAANAGAVLMQYEPRYATGPQEMEKTLTPGEEYVGFDESDFDAKLEQLLNDQEACIRIARQGQARMKKDYDYRTLYHDLFAKIGAETGWRERRVSPGKAALSRIHAYMEVESPERLLAVDDMLAAAEACASHPAAFAMPFYGDIQQTFGPASLADMVGGLPKTEDLRALRLAFYEKAFALIPKPTTVDRFNRLALAAQEGVINLAACRALENELASEPAIAHADMGRILAPKGTAVPQDLAKLADFAMRNFGYLLAKDEAGRQQAARDFMLVWLYWLMALAGDAPYELRAAAKEILEGYPVWENFTVPDYVETKEVPATAVA